MDPNADTYRMNIEKEGDEEIDWEEEEEGIGGRKMRRRWRTEQKGERNRKRRMGEGDWKGKRRGDRSEEEEYSIR